MTDKKDPLFVHLNSMIDKETRAKLSLLAKVRGVELDALIRGQLKALADSITMEHLCFEEDIKMNVEAPAIKPAPTKKKKADKPARPRTYRKRKYRRPCPICQEKQYGQGMVSHVRSCAAKLGIEYLGWEEWRRKEYLQKYPVLKDI